MKKGLSALLFSGLLLTAISSLSADDEKQQEKIHHEILVTATRLETLSSEVASAATVVRVESLTPVSLTQAQNLFARVPGIFFLQTGLSGGTGSVFIRGANSEHTLFMLDGFELNDPISPARSFNFNLFNLGLIDRIEVLRGPQSSLYGSDALAGVVNLISTEPKKNQLELSGLYGSYKTFKGDLRLAQVKKNLFYLLEFNSDDSGGISQASSAYSGNNESDSYTQQSLAFKFKYRPGENFNLSWQARALTARAELDAFGGPGGDDPNSVQKSTFFFNRLELDGFFFNHRWEQKLVLGFQAGRRRNDNPADEFHPEIEEARYKSQFFKLDWQNNLYLTLNHLLIFGFEEKLEQGSSNYSYLSSWGDYQSDFPRQSASLASFYLQDQWRPWSQLSLTSGVRFDHHQKFGPALTFRLAANYDWSEQQTRFKFTLGSGFKAPSLYELYAPPDNLGPIGNMSLEPEKNLGWDAGLEKIFFDHLTLSLTYFETRFRNLIQFYYGTGYQNVGQARTKGLELSIKTAPLKNLELTASWTHLQARDLDHQTDLLRRPKDTFYGNLNFSRKAVRISSEVYYLGQRYDLDFSSYPNREVCLRSAFLVNFFVSYDLKSTTSFFIRGDNLLGTRYEMVYGYGSPGTTISTGFRLKLS
ncbi:MAG TPA: TonB-dependent receptor [Candidatus Saccharicenans sp.]|jgi:vitamin B12 transporter|nr:TonB-dependent receptor [Candidatus Saccharicenans sp.]HRD01408.1 TonB-dependent receptor [Candidatus Saccharicenans sp.]